jgi:putative hemolysin
MPTQGLLTCADMHAEERTAAVTPLIVEWASSSRDVREAQHLRYRVFAEELGARVPSRLHQLDADEFDAYCDHLLVREGHDGAMIGTYRVLTPSAAAAAGGSYVDAAFDLAPLRALRPRLAEVGRACVDARHRTGGVILILWTALADYMAQQQLDTIVGCCSIGLRDGGAKASSLWRRLGHLRLTEPGHRVQPRLPFPVHLLPGQNDEVEVPPLLKGYLQLGARLMGPPAWDPDFGCADLPLLLRLEDVPARYRRRLGAQRLAWQLSMSVSTESKNRHQDEANSRR